MLKRKLLLCILLIFSATLLKAQGEPGNPQLIIIGTIHNGNKYFNHKTLLKVLKNIQPDIVLWEQSIPFRRKLGMLTAHSLKIANVGIEQLVLQKYTRFNKNALVLPYDTTIASRVKYMVELEAKPRLLFDILHKTATNGTMNVDDSMAYANYASIHNKYYNALDTTLERINHPDIWNQTRTVYAEHKKLLTNIAPRYVKDEQLLNWHLRDLEFWDLRNKYMAKQIIQYANRFKGKKIVVLTGMNHKYYLLDILNSDKTLPADIIEFK
jgi:hypothetical protein